MNRVAGPGVDYPNPVYEKNKVRIKSSRKTNLDLIYIRVQTKLNDCRGMYFSKIIVLGDGSWKIIRCKEIKKQGNDENKKESKFHH